MPWSASDACKHDKDACDSDKKAEKWASIANSVLRRTGSDKKAIKIASSKVEWLQRSPLLVEIDERYREAKRAAASNPGDEAAQARFRREAARAGHPNIHAAASDFQEKLRKVDDISRQGWTGEASAEREELERLAKQHGVNPGKFITASQSHAEEPKSKKAKAIAKRAHILHLTRAFGGRHQANIDSTLARVEPKSHSFPSMQHAQDFVEAVKHHYPKMRGVKVKTTRYRTGTPGYPTLPGQTRVSYRVDFTHERLGAPYPEGSRAHAKQQARRMSKKHGRPYHVAVNFDTGQYEATPRLSDAHDPYLTYESGKIAHRHPR